jgi:hypothetical protein
MAAATSTPAMPAIVIAAMGSPREASCGVDLVVASGMVLLLDWRDIDGASPLQIGRKQRIGNPQSHPLMP